MADTFPALLSALVRNDAARPLVTFYDDATGERAELSVATYANWVAKTSSLMVEELDLEAGDRILVDLPTHWLGPVFLGAAWNAGLVVCFPDDETGSAPGGATDDLAAIVCGPDGLAEHAQLAGRIPAIACALLPLGVRFAAPLPAGFQDFGIEVWSQPDSFMPYDTPQPDTEVLRDGTTQQQLVAPTAVEPSLRLADGGRLLTTANPASPTGLASFVSPLVKGGSTVWVRHAEPETWERRYADERATAQQGQPARS